MLRPGSSAIGKLWRHRCPHLCRAQAQACGYILYSLTPSGHELWCGQGLRFRGICSSPP